MDAALLTTRLDFWALANERPTRIQLTTPISDERSYQVFLLTMICFSFLWILQKSMIDAHTLLLGSRLMIFFLSPSLLREKERLSDEWDDYVKPPLFYLQSYRGTNCSRHLRARAIQWFEEESCHDWYLSNCPGPQGWLLKSKYVLRLQSSIKAQWISCAAPNCGLPPCSLIERAKLQKQDWNWGMEADGGPYSLLLHFAPCFSTIQFL